MSLTLLSSLRPIRNIQRPNGIRIVGRNTSKSSLNLRTSISPFRSFPTPISSRPYSNQARDTNDTVNSRKVVNTVDESEITKFSGMSVKWWDEDGPLRTLHHINPTRVKWIKDHLQNLPRDSQPLPSSGFGQQGPLSGLRILDLGCGAGVLSESLALLGAQVVGIDAAETSIRIAKLHAKQDERFTNLEYLHTTAEGLSDQGETFDAVCALEIIEHVSDVKGFLECCKRLLKPNGKLFVSTISRTAQSYALTILAAEKILGIIEPGTHDWDKYIQPKELNSLLWQIGLSMDDVAGLSYNPVTKKCSITKDVSVNYISISSHKPPAQRSPEN